MDMVHPREKKKKEKKTHSGIGLFGLGNLQVRGKLVDFWAKVDGRRRRSGRGKSTGSWRDLKRMKEVKWGRKKAKLEGLGGSIPPSKQRGFGERSRN